MGENNFTYTFPSIHQEWLVRFVTFKGEYLTGLWYFHKSGSELVLKSTFKRKTTQFIMKVTRRRALGLNKYYSHMNQKKMPT